MTKQIMVGGVAVGGGAPVTIQSMCNTKTEDAGATIEQILRLEQAGCEIVRVTVPTPEAAEAVEIIKNRIHIPLVADIHFDYKLAIAAAEGGADKIRINPSNIGGEDRVKAVVDCCRAHKVPIRIGVNGGSLEKELLAKYGRVTPEALVESALGHVALLEKYDFTDICISVKSSDVPLNMAAYRLLHERVDYPLHLGVTEAGSLCRQAHPARLRAAKKRCESDLLPDLRAHGLRYDPAGRGAGAPAGGLRQAHHRRGHGLRCKRPRRGERGGHRRRGRQGRGPYFPSWRGIVQGSAGKAAGRPA